MAKVGEVVAIDNESMLRPLINRIVDLELDGEKISARIMDVGPRATRVTIVSPEVKE